MVGSIVFGLAALAALMVCILDITQPRAVGVADRIGGVVGSLWMSGIILVGLGCVSLVLYKEAMARFYPATHSDDARLKRLVEATRHVDVSGASSPNFYSNASDLEIYALFQQKTIPRGKLPELVYEARKRIHEI